MSYKHILRLLLVIAGIIFTSPSFSQSTGDMSNIRVDELSDTQIRQLAGKLQSIGVPLSKVEQLSITKGMKPDEARKLKVRIDRLKITTASTDLQGQRTVQDAPNFTDSLGLSGDTLSLAEQALSELRSRIFGADIFSKNTSTFEPNLRLATPENYQIGPDDEIILDIYGYSEASYNLTVTPEGTINIPYVGVLQVGGMNIEQARTRIRSRLISIYPGISSGNTNVRIAIGNIRSIKIILTGDIVRPGTYTLPSVASVFNALYESGGPTENGSFREIEVIRGGRKIAAIDIYDFLLNGEFRNNVRLQDNDVIRVPTYKQRVEIVGEIKRPGLFELLEGESLADLLRFTGGFTERAYQLRVKVLKNTPIERKISDITSEQFSTYRPNTGDKIFVDEILDRFENRVAIEGAVFRPGQYELEPGLTLSGLIKKAEGLREDAFRNRGYITRLKDDMQTELLSFDVAKILDGQLPDISLKREDVITISSILDLKEEYYIRVEGEVRQPGRLNYAEGITLEDAILQAGGLKVSATTQRIEVARRVTNSNALSASAQTAEVFQINADKDLKSVTGGFILQPFDIVSVRPSEGYEVQRTVRVEGEVLYPGVYTLTSKDERISDIIKRAGGFTALAYAEGASLKRSEVLMDSVALKKEYDARLADLKKNSVSTKPGEIPTADKVTSDFVGIDLPKIILNPGLPIDIFMEEGDVLNIPKQLQTVKVDGEVLSPVTVVYEDNKGFKDYISSAGGFGEKAKKKRSYIRYANGAVKSTSRFLFINSYPRVRPGSEIIVPDGAVKRPISFTELIGVSSSLITLYLLINSLK